MFLILSAWKLNKKISSGVEEDKQTNWISVFTFQEDRLGFEVMSS
jgi:hypothetical protein